MSRTRSSKSRNRQKSHEREVLRRSCLPNSQYSSSADSPRKGEGTHHYVPGQQEVPVIVTSMKEMLDWAKNGARSHSVWPFSYALACCGIEMMAAVQNHYGLARFGSEVFRNSPRQANLMMVAGTPSVKMAPWLRLWMANRYQPPQMGHQHRAVRQFWGRIL
jgi:hypothetical protein